jgi:hypothetical protein
MALIKIINEPAAASADGARPSVSPLIFALQCK